MTITGLCQPENASQIKLPRGKLNALSGQSIKAQVTQRDMKEKTSERKVVNIFKTKSYFTRITTEYIFAVFDFNQ